MRAWRIAFASAGILLGLYGVVRLLLGNPVTDLLILAAWMVGAVLLHDGVLAPAVVTVGWAVGRVVPARARRYLQAFLVAAALVTVVAAPLLLRRGTGEPGKALLEQDYGRNLSVLLGLLALVSLLAYAAQLAAEHRRRPRYQDAEPPPP